MKVSGLKASLGNVRALGAKFTQTGNRVIITLAKEIVLLPGKPFTITIS